MKKYKKKQLLEMVKTLESANDVIRDGRCKGAEETIDVLSQCQDLAIEVGTDVETRGEEFSRPVVALLEKYCELLYQLSQTVMSGDKAHSSKLTKKIRRQLTAVGNSIRSELPEDKKEVVFLPYKASMWDSLESIWLAARDDENCDAYVIPIPYFDKNPDGSLGQMHYEGDQYPDYVPVTSWQEYSLEERHPDMIFIHNPYDNWNYVTSVHPAFYAEKIRNYTDKLVYVPYFILGEIDPDNQAAIDRMKHFITTPGVIYADRVIVQSEKMKQIYVNEYLKFAAEKGLRGMHTNRQYLEQKILGLGSPKIDKVHTTQKEDLEIPSKWLKIIEKPDGSWKKIIFYNTSISALLANSEAMLEKMEDVFQIFKENQDEVALLWRPHPLIPNTIKSMRPELWEKYRVLVDRYKSEGWGIYDDTADMDRAVVLSDGYYGDSSSIVQVYLKTGKAIMIQDVSVQKG